MTQLYIGNLSAEADEKTVRAVFGKYGIIRDTVMKNGWRHGGYAFLAFDSPVSANAAVKEMNGTDLLGSHIIVELSHQQRTGRKKNLLGRVEVTNIPDFMNWQAVETLLGSVGTVIKTIPEGDFCPPTKGVVVFETIEQAQRAANTFTGDEHFPKVTYIEEVCPSSAGAPLRNAATNHAPMSPTASNRPMLPMCSTSDFSLRILVPNEMVGALVDKETIQNIAFKTKTRIFIHWKENTKSNEKAITIIGSLECCSEASHQIMKIFQCELLKTNGLLEGGQVPPELLPCVPLKLLAHNKLLGRVIGIQGSIVKRIMAETNTNITISKKKGNMERTITVVGTVDNCKKAESIISAKMAHHILPAQQQSNGGLQLNSTLPFSSPPDSPSSSHVPMPTSPTSPYPPNYYYNNSKVKFASNAQNPCGALEVNGLSRFGQQFTKPNNDFPQANGFQNSLMDHFQNGIPNEPSSESHLLNDLPGKFSSLEVSDFDSNKKHSLFYLCGGNSATALETVKSTTFQDMNGTMTSYNPYIHTH